MTGGTKKLIAGAMLAGAGVGFFLLMLLRPWVSSSATKGSGPVPNVAGQEALRQSEPAAITPGEGPLVLERFGESLRTAARTVGAPPGIDVPVALEEDRLDALVELAVRWLGLHVEPDFEAYRAFVLDLTGRDPTAPGYGFFPKTKEDLETSLTHFRIVGIDEQSVQVQVRYRAGRRAEWAPQGVRGMSIDAGGKYSRAGDEPLSSSLSADVFEVRVPVEAVLGSAQPPRRVFIVLSCVWLPDDPRWLPWQIGFDDPSAPRRSSYPPWL